HLGLQTHRIIKDKNELILINKVRAQFHKWANTWSFQTARNQEYVLKAHNQSLADELSRDAKEKIQQIEDLLFHTLHLDDTVDWNQLKDNSKFLEPNPKIRYQTEIKKIKKPQEPHYKNIPKQP